jgi:hypothetical protein
MTARGVELDIDSERLAQLRPHIALGPAASLSTEFCDPSRPSRHRQHRLGITPGAMARAHRAVRKRPSR